MSKPIRIQLSRKKGWRMPENTVKVSRPGPFGNPYKVVQCARFKDDGAPGYAGRHDWELNYPITRSKTEAAQRAVDGFKEMYATSTIPYWEKMRGLVPALRGKNLACWCRLDQPCHADVLLELANRPICEAVSASTQEQG